MALAFHKAVFQLSAGAGTFQLAKPYAALPIFLAHGCVCDALAHPDDSEQKGYLPSEYDPKVQGIYLPHILDHDTLRAEIEKQAPRTGEVIEREIRGRSARVFRVEFPGMDHRTQVDPKEHWFYPMLDEKFASGMVLPGLIRTGDWTKERQPYYGVLQRDVRPNDRRRILHAAREVRREKHAAWARKWAALRAAGSGPAA